MSSKSKMNSYTNKNARKKNREFKAGAKKKKLEPYLDSDSRFMGYNYEKKMKRLKRDS